jgi:hypothetical protein
MEYEDNDYCCKCFYQHLQISNFENKQKYYVRTKNNYSLIDEKWSIYQEKLFIKAFLKYFFNLFS